MCEIPTCKHNIANETDTEYRTLDRDVILTEILRKNSFTLLYFTQQRYETVTVLMFANFCRLDFQCGDLCASFRSILPLTFVHASSMRSLLRFQTLLRQKLSRPTCCNLSFTRRYQISTGFSGPKPTEPFVGDYRPLTWSEKSRDEFVPGEVDVAIIGGGLVGLCTAFFIKHRFPRSFSIAVIEKDPLVRCHFCFCVCCLHSSLLLLQ